MRRRRLIWQIFPIYLGITLLSLIAIGALASKSVRDFYYAQTSAQLKSIARLVNQQVGERFSLLSVAQLDSISIKLGQLSSSRVTFIDRDGRVLGDTDENPLVMENHADRPEIISALAGETGISIRFSPTLKIKMMYLAIPISEGENIVGVVRVSRSVAAIDSALRQVDSWIALGGLIIALLAAGASYGMSRRISRPLEAMKQGADRFAAGDLQHKLAVPPSEEMGRLAEALNQMAAQLRVRISTITQQRSELEAVLSSMMEGVLAVDCDEKILRINQAAAELFDLNQTDVKGSSVPEAIFNPDFQSFVTRVLESGEDLEAEIVLKNGERYLQAHGTHLRDAQGSEIGVLIVLHDVTRLRRLENIRRDFVANVSHELRTPITAIKGFVETLREEGIHNGENADHFLEIISRQTDRLNAIIEDLLALSRIEQEAEAGAIPLETGRIEDALSAAIQNCESKAKEKKIEIMVRCPADLQAMINAPLLEQAVTNLLDNAINYSTENGSITLEVQENQGEFTIQVIDQGCGIEAQHLPRLFERFYRVDKDRSRKMGGTGLGLAIVKHIAIAHGGRVSVDSKPGKGSTFRMHLPKS